MKIVTTNQRFIDSPVRKHRFVGKHTCQHKDFEHGSVGLGNPYCAHTDCPCSAHWEEIPR